MKNGGEIILCSAFMGYLFVLFVSHVLTVFSVEWYFVIIRWLIIFTGARCFQLIFYSKLREVKSKSGEVSFFGSMLLFGIIYLSYFQ